MRPSKPLAIGDTVPLDSPLETLAGCDNAPWRVAIVPRGKELTVGLLVARKGLTCFFPEERVTRRRGRKATRAEVMMPVWPGYLFIRASVDAAISVRRHIRLPNGFQAINGFVGNVSGGAGMAIVPDKEIAALREMASEHGFDIGKWRESRRKTALSVGLSARIMRGAFEGATGLIDRLEGNDCRVLVSLFGGTDIPVQLPREDVEGVPEQ